MANFVRSLIWRIKGVNVYALVGKSGTGKSFRAKLVSQKYRLDLIIDDGLLIKDQKIIAGKSAKKESAYLAAIKTALFENAGHRKEVKEVLDEQKFKRVLIVGISERMVAKISERLGLPAPFRVIRIEDIATQAEIEQAIRARNSGGKHVIPVPAIEVARNYPHLLYETVRVFFKRGRSLFSKKTPEYEKSVVRPEFGKRGKITISEAALTQMVLHCADEFDSSIRIKKVAVRSDSTGYRLVIYLDVPYGKQLSGNLHDLQAYVVENIERYTGILIESADLSIDRVSPTA